jgi:hypothetical protein
VFFPTAFSLLQFKEKYLNIQFLPQRKQNHTITKINWLMLFKGVYSGDHVKSINTRWGQNVELPIVKAGSTYSYN